MPDPALNWRIPVGDAHTTAVLEPAIGPARALFVFAAGAGGHMDDRNMLRLSAQLRTRGLDVVRFNFLYRAQGSRRVDAMARLRACTEAVVERVRTERAPARVILGGRSLGGRVASVMAADGYACDALLLLAYPLHPAGTPEKLRDAHLPSIEVPVLCFNGTRDALCRRDLMEQALGPVRAPWRMHWLAGCDHAFHVLKSSGRHEDEVVQEIGDATDDWLDACFR